MVVLPADHVIKDAPMFQQALRQAVEAALTGKLITFGIAPSRPDTGFGYIQAGASQGGNVHTVQRFAEKPDAATAERFLSEGNYYWNSGMFIWRVDRILDAFRQHMPDLHDRLVEIRNAWDTQQREQVVEKIWPNIKPETIDYGIMEHAADVAVLPALDLGWNDVGSWDSLFEIFPTDERGNIVIGAQHINLDSESSLVVGDSNSRVIVTIGMEDIIVIDTGNALLVCPKGESQRVKEAVALLKQKGMHEYL
jgi:mannose-1-phosphate guanylyltransferase